MNNIGFCSGCGQDKELTVHNICWKCHLSSLSVPKTGCGDCSSKKTKTAIAQTNGRTVITRSDRKGELNG